MQARWQQQSFMMERALLIKDARIIMSGYVDAAQFSCRYVSDDGITGDRSRSDG